MPLRRGLMTLGLLTVFLLSATVGAVVKPAAASPSGDMTFGVLDSRVSYGITSYDTQAVQNADLNMLLSTDASCIRTDINYQPWLTPTDPATISLVTNVIGQIRTAQKCLIIADAGSQSYRTTPIPWAQFETAWVQRVQTLAQTYRPDYYIVVKEPRWYGPMISDETTNPLVSNATEWVGLTQQLIAAVQSVSPNTKVGVSIDAGSFGTKQYGALYDSYIQGVSQLPGLSFIGFDIYGQADEAATQSYLSQYGVGAKDVWVAEAWSTTDGSALNGDPNQDASWMTNDIYPFATSIHATFLIPFYTDDFSSYAWDTNPTDIVGNYSLRTPVFGAFQSLALEYGTAPTGVPEFASSVVGVVAISVAALAVVRRRMLTATR